MVDTEGRRLMGSLGLQRRRGAEMVQGKQTAAAVLAAMPGPLALIVTLLLGGVLAGCNGENPVMTPVGWWHDLKGGAIAADRPPPPGADLPYPKIYTIPPKPVLPSDSFRQTVETSLAQERDDAERLAAHAPIVVQPAPPPPPPPPAAPAGMEGAETQSANATMPAADAPPPKPDAARAAAAPVGASGLGGASADGGPAPGTPLTFTSAGPDMSNLPQVPAAPPPPATFEGMPAEPAPTPPPRLPAHVPLAAQGTQVLFRPDDAVLDVSQTQTMKDAASHRGKGSIEVEGHGDAQSDSPEGQEAALKLALKRAQAVAKGLEAQHVPASAIRIAATAFGRGASLQIGP
jgi:outer membrane protein OmpA-like peptidoglycan-associated protein